MHPCSPSPGSPDHPFASLCEGPVPLLGQHTVAPPRHPT